MKLYSNTGWTYFVSIGAYFLLRNIFPDLFEGGFSILFFFVIPSFINQILRNPKNRKLKERVETIFPNDDTKEQEIKPQNLVECPYCSHMNNDQLTFCEKCNGLL